MTTTVTWTGGAIVYAPLHGGPPIGSGTLGIDANLSQYTQGSSVFACLDVNGAVLWSMVTSDIQQAFFNAGASFTASTANFCQVLLSPDGENIVFIAEWPDPTDSAGHQSMFVGVAPINAVGDIAVPVLTNYLRLHNAGSAGTFYSIFSLHEMTDGAGVQTSLVLQAVNLTLSPPTVFIFLPTITELIAGTYKGSHPGCAGSLGPDQGPVFQVSWNNSTSVYAAESNNTVHAGAVTQNPIGFMLNVGGAQRFYYVTPKGWMTDPSSLSGFFANWHVTHPDGGAFYLDFSAYSTYAAHTWSGTTITDNVSLTTDAIDITSTDFLNANLTPSLPWADEFTRILDGGPNEGWIATYNGRPAIINRGANPSVMFPIIDGNPDYSFLIGAGERVYYARVRNYVWNTIAGAFVAVNVAGGIVLRNGDLGVTNYVFSDPGSQLLAAYSGNLYLQIVQQAGGVTKSLLTKFGQYGETTGTRRRAAVRRITKGVGGKNVISPTNLPDITLSSTSAVDDVAAGTLLATFTNGAPAGSVVAISPNDGRIAVNGSNTGIVRGMSAWADGPIALTFTTTNTPYGNSPHVSPPITFTVESPIPASINVPIQGTDLTAVWNLQFSGTGPSSDPTNGTWSGSIDAYLTGKGFVDSFVTDEMYIDIGAGIVAISNYNFAGSKGIDIEGTGTITFTDCTFDNLLARGVIMPCNIQGSIDIDAGSTLTVHFVRCHWNNTTWYMGSGTCTHSFGKHTNLTSTLGDCKFCNLTYSDCYIPGGGAHPAPGDHVELCQYAGDAPYTMTIERCMIDCNGNGQASLPTPSPNFGWTAVWSLIATGLCSMSDSIVIGLDEVNANPLNPNRIGFVWSEGSSVTPSTITNCVMEVGCFGYTNTGIAGPPADGGGNRTFTNVALTEADFG